MIIHLLADNPIVEVSALASSVDLAVSDRYQIRIWKVASNFENSDQKIETS